MRFLALTFSPIFHSKYYTYRRACRYGRYSRFGMMHIKYLALLSFSTTLMAQNVELRSVDIVYGDKVIRGQHQVVVSSPAEVVIVPPEKKRKLGPGPILVISNSRDKPSYLDESEFTRREEEIYSEVNRRTEDAPFTVLFTGHIPDDIQQKRMQMMPEVGIFGDQLDKLNNDLSGGDIVQEVGLPEDLDGGVVDTGKFSQIQPGERVTGTAASPGERVTGSSSSAGERVTGNAPSAGERVVPSVPANAAPTNSESVMASAPQALPEPQPSLESMIGVSGASEGDAAAEQKAKEAMLEKLIGF